MQLGLEVVFPAVPTEYTRDPPGSPPVRAPPGRKVPAVPALHLSPRRALLEDLRLSAETPASSTRSPSPRRRHQPWRRTGTVPPRSTRCAASARPWRRHGVPREQSVPTSPVRWLPPPRRAPATAWVSPTRSGGASMRNVTRGRRPHRRRAPLPLRCRRTPGLSSARWPRRAGRSPPPIGTRLLRLANPRRDHPGRRHQPRTRGIHRRGGSGDRRHQPVARRGHPPLC